MNQASPLRLTIVSLVLAAGFGIVWGFATGFSLNVVESLFAPRQTSENLFITYEGTPLIESRLGGNYFRRRWRTLDGKRVEVTEDQRQIYPTTMYKPRPERVLFAEPITWRNRLQGISDSEVPPVFWSLIRTADTPGRVYLAGFHALTGQNVGYIARNGLSDAVPSRDEWFDVGNAAFFYFSQIVTSTGYINEATSNFDNSYRGLGPKMFQPWTFFICDGTTVQQINLRDHQVSAVAKFENLVGIEVSFVLTDTEKATATTESRLLVRTHDQLILYDVFDSSQVEFPIPSGLENEQLSIVPLSDERLMLEVDRGYWEHGTIVDLMTITPSGESETKAGIRLVNYVPQSLAKTAWMAVAIAPAFLFLVIAMWVVAPLGSIADGEVQTFQQGFYMYFEPSWPPLLLLFLISLVLASVVLLWQRKYARSNTPMWTTLVFLTTLPGFFAYWVMHRPEPLATCPSCKREVPRNREACARCAEPFPEPKLLGTEIFA